MRPYDVVIYGAYGYTGKLIARECRTREVSALLSGRDASRLQALSDETDYPFEPCDLDDGQSLLSLLKKSRIVIHCAGPFQFTAKQMVEACLLAGTHYLDITGEYNVFELLSQYDGRARDKGIIIMPGVGFDVVPSDCLAVRLKSRMPEATHLVLAFTMSKGGVSRGTARTMVEGLGYGSMVRRDGKLVARPLGKMSMDIDFGEFQQKAMCIPWGDISTAWRSTGIPNIEVYTAVPQRMINLAKWSPWLNWLLKKRWVKKYLRKRVDAGPAGPDEVRLTAGQSYLWGCVHDDKGNTLEARLKTANGYLLTSRAAVLIAVKVLSGNVRHGYFTPAQYFGEGLILEVEGSSFY